MKAKIAILVIVSLFFVCRPNRLVGCPTCVGRLNKSDDPFFSNRYYQNLTGSSNTISKDDTPDVENELGDTDEESD